MNMKSFFLLLILPFIAYCEGLTPEEGDETEKPATIKVLLKKEASGVLLEARGPFVVYNPENGKKVSAGKGKRFYLYPHEEGIKWGENFLGIFQLQVVPTSPTTTFLLDGVQYRGAIELYHIEGTLGIVNEVDVESYVKATLNEKLKGKSFHQRVMDAIAIIARTNAYYKVFLNPAAFWHVSASEVGYCGVGLTLQNIEAEKGVDRTRHLVMTYNHQPFPGVWTEHCGGKTADYASMFRKEVVAPRGVEVPVAMQEREASRWALTVETRELAKLAKTNRVTGIDLFVEQPANKVYGARLHDGSRHEDIDFLTLQQGLGAAHLKSNDFKVSIKGTLAVFEGYGEGIGTGLCLYSATEMARRGEEAPQILSLFFPDTTLEKMRSYPETLLIPKHPGATKKTYRLLH